MHVSRVEAEVQVPHSDHPSGLPGFACAYVARQNKNVDVHESDGENSPSQYDIMRLIGKLQTVC